MAEVKSNGRHARKIFITVLGITPYEETEYYLEDKPYKTYITKFAPIAVLRLMQDKPDVVVPLMTKEAELNTWNKGFESELRSLGFKHFEEGQEETIYKPLRIPEGVQNVRDDIEQIIWSIFNELPNHATVYFDITHGFRHLPMLIMLLLHYAKVIKNIEVGGVYYAAFKSKAEKSPILNLKFFSELQDWTRAIARFVHTGDVALLYEIIMDWAQPRLRESKGKDRVALLIRNLAENLSKLIGYIQTSRGPVIARNKEGNELNQILNDILQKQSITNEIPVTIIPLLEILKNKVKQFDRVNSIDNLLYAVEFCIDHGLIQQGYTLLREYVVSKIEQEMVQAGMSDVTKQCTLRVIADIMFGFVARIRKDDDSLSVDDAHIPKQCREVEEKMKKILSELLNLKTVRTLINNREVLSKLVERRNDINHAGFGRNSANYKTLQEELRELHEAIKTILTKI
ncbi:MAG: TIGR02221 family CRISPR-associated protein [Chlorobi bacterium]|nr:TIGR02221 family CRISPR-associated protein [Chlorobiota bacterium]